MHGSCKCGRIKYTADKPLKAVNCHCTLCRGMNGAAFSSYVVVMADRLVIENEPGLHSYAATARATKHFCSHCGTPIYNSNPTTYPGLAMLYMGSVSEHASIIPDANIYCSTRLEWLDAEHTIASFNDGPQSN